MLQLQGMRWGYPPSAPNHTSLPSELNKKQKQKPGLGIGQGAGVGVERA